eukprot:CAMPEP_0181217038 /NCGR_PEP_ID=MMETSP1096-20121128/26922_1 /TAXON_ID=156174 ORGANISM="Chrysochromulina ericina, Strain CCMP281" /NCGR_SAMPLE_ID=MMETSP1096 /ASSEMBLY_ACC=CAM_ASM_000453 /LENGTH=112 /DNA_ID=CAMNT_0023309111 /DNA_START=61 /DNA_END=400 /DNA_ORIENTATION=+
MPLSPDSQHQATRWQRVMGALMLSPDSFAYSIRARMGGNAHHEHRARHAAALHARHARQPHARRLPASLQGSDDAPLIAVLVAVLIASHLVAAPIVRADAHHGRHAQLMRAN